MVPWKNSRVLRSSNELVSSTKEGMTCVFWSHNVLLHVSDLRSVAAKVCHHILNIPKEISHGMHAVWVINNQDVVFAIRSLPCWPAASSDTSTNSLAASGSCHHLNPALQHQLCVPTWCTCCRLGTQRKAQI